MSELTTRRNCPITNRSVARARSDSAAFLAACGMDREGEFASELVLFISELMTNAVTHGRVPGTSGRRVGMSIEKTGNVYRVEVRDTQGDRMPVLYGEGNGDGVGGRGLLLVDSLSDKWGVRPEVVGKIVWAEKEFGTGEHGGE
ncbi:ATP-binding protein [Streptomyces ipomoeae]|uniref:ATP-binding protein n=1 Tax=Streptomyces ipomoeae TaxID=103232 RepID=UPI0029BF0A9F|nr:ATP-binding protein [Streptomyces ipomoeae]MDX2825067.1 ATP-binding protein [Streptomyces ipomoeae]MDX2877641.1 ATP-binding protein [Streptomyces ipomoeae]